MMNVGFYFNTQQNMWIIIEVKMRIIKMNSRGLKMPGIIEKRPLGD